MTIKPNIALRPARSRRGNAIVESTLCFLMFVLIFFGIMECGLAVFTYNFVSYAAREGARYASTRGSLCTNPCVAATSKTVESMVRSEAVALDTSKLAVATTWNPNNIPGNTVTVAVSYPLQPLIGLTLGNMTLKAQSTMTIAQ